MSKENDRQKEIEGYLKKYKEKGLAEKESEIEELFRISNELDNIIKDDILKKENE